ncbi:MAG: M6 family metalloprotease domain-containing protein [Bacteroidia bacterium]|nr:M6 family metalloprotease domain-containing protein [Bacteroidia bacterium]
MKRITFLAFGLLLCRLIFADNVVNVPQTITQPNGKIINCLGSGDEYYHRLHDANGYTIVLNPKDGYFYYGIRSGETVVPSKYVAGTVNPANVGLEKNAMISEQLYAERRAKFQAPLKAVMGTPTKGLVNSLCIYISFADDSVFTRNRAYFKEMWEATDKSSVQDYFKEISYNLLDLEIYHFPVSPDTITVSYKDIYPRNYYLPKSAANPEGYDGDNAAREHSMLKRAVEFIQNQIPADVDVDRNNDGIVDNICFVIKGNSSAWADLLWPHAWGLYSYDVRVKGARINGYFLTMENGFGAGTMCHELGHVFGAPDLYHYYDSGKTGPSAVGGWCLMDASADPPQSICGFLKYKYNHWISDLPEITESGVYSLKPLSQPTNNLFKIKSPFSRTEYFVLEYRKRAGRYESSAPGTGLVVYRINPGAGSGNAGGPPDEVYVYRPGGSITEVGSLSSAGMIAPSRTAINDKTDPNSFLWNNGDSGPGGLDLFNVSAARDSITFEVRIVHLYPPTELEYTPGAGQVDLTWVGSMAQDLTTYYVYRNGIRYADTQFSDFTDYDIVEGQVYTYWITAFYQGGYNGESVKSNEVTYAPKGIQILPYREDFEQPAHGWKIKGNVEGFQWGDATSLTMQTINTTKFLGANSVAAGVNTLCSDYAITPRMNFYGKNKVYMHFDYSLKRWQQLDHLKIFFRRYQNESWVPVIDLPTSGIGAGYKWKKYNLELPADCYTGEAQIGFRYDDGNDLGYGAAIDNVVIDEIATSGVETNLDNLAINIYPNPAGDETTLDISGNPGGELSLKLISIDGKVLWSKIRQNQSDGLETINLKGLAKGMYYVVVESANEVIIKSLVKQN